MKLAIAYIPLKNIVGIYSKSTSIFTTYDGSSISVIPEQHVKIVAQECDKITPEQSSDLVGDPSLTGYIISLIYKEDNIVKLNLVKGDEFTTLSYVIG